MLSDLKFCSMSYPGGLLQWRCVRLLWCEAYIKNFFLFFRTAMPQSRVISLFIKYQLRETIHMPPLTNGTWVCYWILLMARREGVLTGQILSVPH